MVLALEPRILVDVLRSAVKDEPDMQVVSEASDPVELLLAVQEQVPDVVVLMLSDHGRLPPIGTHLLAEFPELLIIGITSRGERVVSFRNAVRTEQHSLGSVRQLIARLRAAVANHPV